MKDKLATVVTAFVVVPLFTAALIIVSVAQYRKERKENYWI